MSDLSFDATELVVRLLKYAFEGGVTALAAYFIPSRGKLGLEEILVIALIAAATFAVLDLFAPSIGATVRSGAGWGIGMNLVGFPASNNPVNMMVR